MIDTELYKKNEISVFFDIGTNGELVIGNKEFLLCGAGAAGPALEGGVVRTGMRAEAGAVDEVKIRDGNIYVHVIGSHKEDSGSHEKNSGNHEENSSGEEPRGICGSGIIDLIAELFLEGWIDIRGKLSPEKALSFRRETTSSAWNMPRSVLLSKEDIDDHIINAHQIRRPHRWKKSCSVEDFGLATYLNQADRFKWLIYVEVIEIIEKE